MAKLKCRSSTQAADDLRLLIIFSHLSTDDLCILLSSESEGELGCIFVGKEDWGAGNNNGSSGHSKYGICCESDTKFQVPTVLERKVYLGTGRPMLTLLVGITTTNTSGSDDNRTRYASMLGSFGVILIS